MYPWSLPGSPQCHAGPWGPRFSHRSRLSTCPNTRPAPAERTFWLAPMVPGYRLTLEAVSSMLALASSRHNIPSFQFGSHKTRLLNYPKIKSGLMDPDTNPVVPGPWLDPVDPVPISAYAGPGPSQSFRLSARPTPVIPRSRPTPRDWGIRLVLCILKYRGPPTCWPHHPRILARSLYVDTTRWSIQNLWMGGLVKPFVNGCQSHSVKIGRATYFLECTDNNARPQDN